MAEQLIAEGAVREITDYAAYPSLKGFEYFEDFSQLLNGTLYEEFDTITSAPGLAGDGTTTFKLYYVSVLVDYEVQYWKVSGDGVATRVLDEHGNGVSDWRQAMRAPTPRRMPRKALRAPGCRTATWTPTATPSSRRT